ncbi:MAG: hypothetical protein CVV64_07395 [Candidatus Wallbacteria bacterium HGW-Wallbacteria-1]|jgi:hypothetical protein|uniref:Uncharacterized protein n=1 Tax=Candidatus Wallbacteria bacterium HGW-Wallbacteria-1 TaxID=2013854 RepID=A0A2N1PQV1_9BACT|nr:MAG: hypothetical protein CVV64_07395 [Candidatus Wallbacteria bacterium HGW-Wallbacteria-1]
MTYKVYGSLQSVLFKPVGSLTVQDFDILFFDSQMVFCHMGNSTFLSAMLGNLFLGVAGSVGAAGAANTQQDIMRNEISGFAPSEICALSDMNISLPYDLIESIEISTGFFATLGLLSPMWIKCEGKKYFVNVPRKQALEMPLWLSGADEIFPRIIFH